MVMITSWFADLYFLKQTYTQLNLSLLQYDILIFVTFAFHSLLVHIIVQYKDNVTLLSNIMETTAVRKSYSSRSLH
jgi:hypothetical protein